MKNVERVIILYPAETSSERVSKPGNYSLSRLLIHLHKSGEVPIYFLNSSARHEQWGSIEFIHFTTRNFLRILRRFAFQPGTLIISQTGGSYHRHAKVLRAMMPGSRILARLEGVYYGKRYLESPAFGAERRRHRRRLASADMIIGAADGTLLDLYMARLGIPTSRYKKWLYGLPRIPNTGGRKRGNTILCVSRLHPEKAVDYVIRSFARALPRLAEPHTLVIVGDGTERRNLEELTRTLGVDERVEFVGHSDDVGAHLYSSKLLMAGLSNLPILEAIATGTPVIALELGELEALYGHVPNVHVVPYPPGGYGRIPAEHLETVTRDTADRIVAVLNDYPRLDGVDPAATYGLETWEERIKNELDLYEELLAPTPSLR